MIYYLDTSAALKLLVTEPESDALAAWLTSLDPSDHLVSSFLLYTQLHCAAQRRAALPRDSVEQLLSGVSLVRVEEEHLVLAARQGWGLRAGDAIHLATALLLPADALISYDKELLETSSTIGLQVTAPGAADGAATSQP